MLANAVLLILLFYRIFDLLIFEIRDIWSTPKQRLKTFMRNEKAFLESISYDEDELFIDVLKQKLFHFKYEKTVLVSSSYSEDLLFINVPKP